jgi:hypothetical protein
LNLSDLNIPLATHRAGSVTERLSARLDEVEAIQARTLANEAKLIADSVTMDATVAQVRRDAAAQAAYVERRWLDAGRYTATVSGEHVAFVHRTFWGRLRWLVRGR